MLRFHIYHTTVHMVHVTMIYIYVYIDFHIAHAKVPVKHVYKTLEACDTKWQNYEWEKTIFIYKWTFPKSSILSLNYLITGRTLSSPSFLFRLKLVLDVGVQSELSVSLAKLCLDR